MTDTNLKALDETLQRMSDQLQELTHNEVNALMESLASLEREFDKLPPPPPERLDLFRLFRRTADELTHSNILAFLFDPSAAHQLGSKFLRRFCRMLGFELDADDHLIRVDREVYMPIRDAEISDVKADIVIEAGDRLLIIENKIYASEGWQQTSRIERACIESDRYSDMRKCFVYLTLHGDPPQNAENFVSITYHELIPILEELDPQGTETKMLLSSFIRHVKEDFYQMSDGKSRKALSDRARLYLKYFEQIKEIDAAFQDDVNKMKNWRAAIDDLFPDHSWDFMTNPNRSYQQLYKKDWYSNNFFLHYEIQLNIDHLRKNAFLFCFDVEGSRARDLLSMFDTVPGLKDHVASISSLYRPSIRRQAIAYKKYTFDPDSLADFERAIRNGLDEHSFLTEIVDEVIAQFNAHSE